MTTTVRYGRVDLSYWEQLRASAATATAPLWTICLVQLRDRADYPDGDRGLTGAQAYDKFFFDDLVDTAGGEIVFSGDVVRNTPPDPDWHRLTVVLYPNAAALLGVLCDPEWVRRHRHLDAGVTHSISVTGCPMEQPTDHVPTHVGDDGIINVLLWQYRDPYAPEKFLAATKGLAGTVGASREGWFEVDGTLVSDGRQWDEVFFARYPSIEAYDELNAHPVWRRESAILKSGAQNCQDILVKPTLNVLRASLQ